jgi:hypothetical protein
VSGAWVGTQRPSWSVGPLGLCSLACWQRLQVIVCNILQWLVKYNMGNMSYLTNRRWYFIYCKMARFVNDALVSNQGCHISNSPETTVHSAGFV